MDATDSHAMPSPSGKAVLLEILHKSVARFYTPEEFLVFSFIASHTEKFGLSVAQIAQGLSCEPFTEANTTIYYALLGLKGIVQREAIIDNTTAALYAQGLENTHQAQTWTINYKTATEVVFQKCMHIFHDNESFHPPANDDPKQPSPGEEYWCCALCDTVALPHEVPSLEFDDDTGECVCPVCPESESGEKALMTHVCAETASEYPDDTDPMTNQSDPERTLKTIESRANSAFPDCLRPILDIIRLFIQHGPFYFPDKTSRQSDASLILSKVESEKKAAVEAVGEAKKTKASVNWCGDTSMAQSSLWSDKRPSDPPWFRTPERAENTLPPSQVVFNFAG
ncbi:multi-copy suppressor of Chk1 [Perkinsela sp. CCAP 1560/4]|nr:multi-copy suppressor of Chk1 [Perkinsela sp. CCAP 1560/4]|eukprot:KNH06408.1 multi-copy suppressor of Chk1 [Perkinsela sp. CCAP 1560/4]